MTHGMAAWKIQFGGSRTELCGCVRARWVLLSLYTSLYRHAAAGVFQTFTWAPRIDGNNMNFVVTGVLLWVIRRPVLSLYRHFFSSVGRFRGGPGSPRRPHVLPVGDERRLPEHGQPADQRLRRHGGRGRGLHWQRAGRDVGRAPAGVGHQSVIRARTAGRGEDADTCWCCMKHWTAVILYLQPTGPPTIL